MGNLFVIHTYIYPITGDPFPDIYRQYRIRTDSRIQIGSIATICLREVRSIYDNLCKCIDVEVRKYFARFYKQS